jgi:large repetitive protein
LSPYGRIKVNWLTLDPFTETGAGTGALSYSGQSSSIVTAVLGFRGKADFLTHWGIVSPRLRAEYNHAFQSGSTVSLQFADWLNGPTYAVDLARAKSDYLVLGVGTDFNFTNGVMLAIDYQTWTAFLDTEAHQFKLLLKRSF